MIKHIVIFKTEKNAPLQEIKRRIEDLKTKIPQIIRIEVGIDINFDPASSDFSVYTEVKDVKDLEIYAKHPEHLKVIEFIKQYVTERKVIDYEV